MGILARGFSAIAIYGLLGSGCASAEKSTSFELKPPDMRELTERASVLSRAIETSSTIVTPDYDQFKRFSEAAEKAKGFVDADVFLTRWLNLARGAGPHYSGMKPAVQSALRRFAESGASVYTKASAFSFYTDKVPISSTERRFVLPLEGSAHFAFDLPIGGAVTAKIVCPGMTSQISASMRDLFTSATPTQTVYIKSPREIESRLNLNDGKSTAIELIVFPSPIESSDTHAFPVVDCGLELRRTRPDARDPVSDEVGRNAGDTKDLAKLDEEFRKARTELSRRYLDPEISLNQRDAVDLAFSGIVRFRNSVIEGDPIDGAITAIGETMSRLEKSWKRLGDE